MALSVTCACGKSYSVADKYEGKPHECQSCHRYTMVWGPNHPRPTPVANPSPAPQPPTPPRPVVAPPIFHTAPQPVAPPPVAPALTPSYSYPPPNSYTPPPISAASPSTTSRRLAPQWIAAAAVGIVVILGGGIFALTRGGGPPKSGPEKPPIIVDTEKGKTPDPEPRKSLKTEEIVKRMAPKVARIKGEWGVGSGFLIKPGLLVTNAHVVNDEFATDMEVYFPSATTDKGPFKGQVIYKDEKRDLAFLKLTATTESLSMARDFTFRSGMDVTIIGSPGLGSGDKVLENAVSRGILSAKTDVNGQPFFQLNASINGGNSGGPVFDDFGDVIGVASATFRGKEALALCIPIEDLAQAVERVAAQTRADEESASNRHQLQTLSRLLSLYTLRFAEGLQIYTKFLEVAAEKKVPAQKGIDAAAELVDPRLVKLIRAYEERLKNEITAISSNRSTPPLVSQHLVDLFSTYSVMKRTIDNPPADPNAFRQKVRELIDDRRIHVEALEVLLGFNSDPDLFGFVFKDIFEKK